MATSFVISAMPTASYADAFAISVSAFAISASAFVILAMPTASYADAFVILAFAFAISAIAKTDIM
ncbi:hypothetical protein [Nostoc sp.]|uniref:hypothetical protein n=1 Tax=Nostoc sp. TaxID=1180 RepID=UPI002FF539BE